MDNVYWKLNSAFGKYEEVSYWKVKEYDNTGIKALFFVGGGENAFLFTILVINNSR